MTHDEIRSLVIANNQSTTFSTELLICQIWKESGFNPNAVNGSHRGLMQISPNAVNYVNANTPNGIHFTHAEMFTPARNIQCGTWYLRKLQEHNNWSVATTLNHFGTGTGYADNILTCATCLQANTTTPQPCLDAIHP